MKIIFICTGNSCRSQMAEGLARKLGNQMVQAYSAGLFPAGLHERAVAVMAELGIDIGGQYSKEIEPAFLRQMDLVVTLCGNAERYCPEVPSGVRRLHWPIKDPVGTHGSEEEIRCEFRRARDEIKERILELFENEVPGYKRP